MRADLSGHHQVATSALVVLDGSPPHLTHWRVASGGMGLPRKYIIGKLHPHPLLLLMSPTGKQAHDHVFLLGKLGNICLSLGGK